LAQAIRFSQGGRMVRGRNSIGRVWNIWKLGQLMVCVALMALLWPKPALADSKYDSPYTRKQTYHASLRLVRIDLGFKVTEKDAEAGYILFEYKSNESGEKISPGAIEIVSNKDGIRVIVKLSQMPRYHEQVIVNRLTKKLRAEYGDPPPKRKEPSKDNKEKEKEKDKDKEQDKDKDKSKEKKDLRS
jgi:hypothetical protein